MLRAHKNSQRDIFLRSGRYFAICQQKIEQHKFDRRGHPELSIKMWENLWVTRALAWTLKRAA